MSFIEKDFGNVSGRMAKAGDNFIACEITGKGVKNITSIIAQYGKTDAAQNTEIVQGRLIVYREEIDNLQTQAISPFGANDNPKIIFDANINDYVQFVFNPFGKFLESKSDGALTIVLIYPANSNDADIIGRLTVLGDSRQSQLNNVKINKD